LVPGFERARRHCCGRLIDDLAVNRDARINGILSWWKQRINNGRMENYFRLSLLDARPRSSEGLAAKPKGMNQANAGLSLIPLRTNTPLRISADLPCAL
jgi:hypothetical protein